MIIDSVVLMAQTTVALIFACILGVSGIVSDLDFTDDAMIVLHRQPWGMAFGGTAFGNVYNIDHELGHLAQEQEYGALYPPLVALPSVMWNLLSRAGVLPWSDYYYRWPENDADRRGGVNDIR